ncbi:MAG: hypothetical protein GF309_01260 [Candidatus Lokiarchaeota archaeon]|nr:hypothetical protein [Candidatus Lokiarchaeota archaeon]
MDFVFASMIAGLVTSLLLVVSLIVYARSVHSVKGRIASNTLHALILFGGAGVALAGLSVASSLYSGTAANRPWIVLFFAFLIVSQVKVATKSKRIHYATYGIVILAILFGMVVAHASPTQTSPILLFVLSIIFAASLLLSLFLLWDSPSPFSAGMLVLLAAFLVSWISIVSGIFQQNPEYFLVLFVPAIIDSALLASMLKPWRRIITLVVLFTGIVVGTSMFIASFLAGDTRIWLLTVFSFLAAFSAIGGIDFFVEQYQETRARIPGYISIFLVSLSLLIINHIIFFGVFETYGHNDWNLLYLEWVIGVVAAGAYVMTSIQPMVSTGTSKYARRFVLAFMAVMTVLGNEYVRYGRWVYDDIFPLLLSFVGIGVIGYILVVRRLLDSGNRNAAANFVGLMTGALATAFVIEYSDNLPFVVTLILLIITTVMIYRSSPREFSFLTE